MYSESSLATFGPLSDAAGERDVKWVFALAICVTLAVGCRRSDEIRRYEVSKPPTTADQDDDQSSVAPDSGRDDAGFVFEKPETWKEGQNVVSRSGITIVHQAAFEVADGQNRVTITVDRMPALGTLLQNVNRWRMQVGLTPTTQEQLDDLAQSLQIDEAPADYVELVGPNATILAAVAVRGKEAWYLKLMGANELANREKDNFQDFLKSVEFK